MLRTNSITNVFNDFYGLGLHLSSCRRSASEGPCRKDVGLSFAVHLSKAQIFRNRNEPRYLVNDVEKRYSGECIARRKCL